MSGVTETLSWRREGPALEVALHRAPCNEIGLGTLADLERLVGVLQGGAEQAQVVIFYSRQPAGFCAGADLRELHAGLVARRQRLRDRLGAVAGWPGVGRVAARAGRELVGRRLRGFIDRIHAVMDAIDTLPLPTVAVLHGVTFGGGLELALTADLRVAEKSARLAFPELRLGLIPGFGGLPRLEREVGNGVIRDLLLTGRTLGARRAQEIGLVSQVVERGAGLEAARALAQHLASYAPLVTAQAKAFTKTLPAARLEAEKKLFCQLVTQPEVLAALDRFVTSTDARPYLP